jgi:hypothetical protein
MVLGARRRLPGGSFGAAVDVASPITFTGARGGRIIRQAGIDEAGNAAAAWIDFELGQLFVGSDGPVFPTVPAPVTSVPVALPAVTMDPEPEPESPAGPVGGSLPTPVPPVVPAPAPAPPLGPGVLKPVPAPLALRARVMGASAHRRAEVRIHCSSACAARVTATLGKKVHLRAVGVMLRRRGEARVTVALPARRRGAHGRAWLAVAVTATGTDGSHARSSARVRVRA